jgi:VCBS repeat-containing protein
MRTRLFSFPRLGILGNDYDVDGNELLTSVLVSGPAHGTLTLNPDGSFTYTPAENFCGEDSFTYKAYDGELYSNVATVRIVVTCVNDAPVARDDSYTTDEDTPLLVPAPGSSATTTTWMVSRSLPSSSRVPPTAPSP